ncbi:MAG: LysR family transcriptional regulator [Alphaproteobacteria bacterium]|nr:LysR family transcriptional regulator [Alphaproteobacteria bacterium]
MDAADLRIFEAVARLGGMNRAAGELHTVQSNVTHRIRLLEDELGSPLFRRNSRGVTLTAAGERLMPYAVRVGQLLSEARRAVDDTGTPQGKLAIGSLESTLALRLSPALASYAKAFPDVDLTIETGTSAELVDAVLARKLDGAFVCGPVEHAALAGETVFQEDLALVTPPALRRLGDLTASNGVKIVVLRAGCSYRQRLEEILARRGIVGLRRLEFGTLDAIIGCVAAGIGVTLLPRNLVEAPRRAGKVRIHALSSAESRVDTVFIHRRDAMASSALTAFVAHTEQTSRAGGRRGRGLKTS